MHDMPTGEENKKPKRKSIAFPRNSFD